MRFFQALILVLLSLSGYSVQAETVTAAQIVQRTLTGAPACLNWRWVGNCLWMNCDLLGCKVTTSVKVRHFLPDLLVTVQRAPVPICLGLKYVTYAGIDSICDTSEHASICFLISARSVGVAMSLFQPTLNAMVMFVSLKRVSLVIHLRRPPSQLTNFYATAVTRPGKPYYQSALDATAWRFAPTESLLPEALLPGRREVGGSPLQNWGSVYPRSGFIVQQDPAKAAAVIAQRACDIVIGPGRDHERSELESPAPYTSVPTYLNERDSATGRWQMISPKVDATCELFGSGYPDWSVGRIDESRAFIWNLWRPL